MSAIRKLHQFLVLTNLCLVSLNSAAQEGQSLSVAIRPSISLFAVPLICKQEGTTNVLSNVFGNNLPDGFAVAEVAENGEFVYYRFSTVTGWSDPNATLLPGEGAIVLNPSESEVTIEVNGVVAGRTATNNIPAGFSLCSSLVPKAGLITTDLGFPAANGDSVFKFIPTSSFPWRFLFFNGIWIPFEPTIAVGDSFWIRKLQPAQWVQVSDMGSAAEYSYGATPAFGGTNVLSYSTLLLPDFKTENLQIPSGTDVSLDAGTSTADSYQWQRDGVDLDETVSAQGTKSPKLKLIEAGRDRSGNYSVSVQSGTTIGAHRVAKLKVVTPAKDAPSIEGSASFGPQGFLQHFGVESERDYRIQASTDMVHWADALSFFSTNTLFQWKDQPAPDQQRKFYRIVSP
jgi:hypothetical protein